MSKALEPIGEVLFQGVTLNEFSFGVDLASLADAGIGAVVLRATAGEDYTDAGLRARAEAVAQAGLRLGFYHYLIAEDEAEARAQALRFAAAIEGYAAALRPSMLFDALNGLTFDTANRIAQAFLETVEAQTGVAPAVYTDAQSANLLWNREIAEKYPLWVIDVRDDAAPDAGASPWRGWAGWQYALRSDLPGAAGPVPLSRFTAEMLSAQIVPPAQVQPQTLEIVARKLICVTVVYGDTLSAIARLFDTSVRSIARLNNIRNPNLIFPGQRLYIWAPESAPVECCDSYTVRRGDTLSGIAERFSTRWRRLASINEIPNPDLIYPGQVIKLGLCPDEVLS